VWRPPRILLRALSVGCGAALHELSPNFAAESFVNVHVTKSRMPQLVGDAVFVENLPVGDKPGHPWGNSESGRISSQGKFVDQRIWLQVVNGKAPLRSNEHVAGKASIVVLWRHKKLSIWRYTTGRLHAVRDNSSRNSTVIRSYKHESGGFLRRTQELFVVRNKQQCSLGVDDGLGVQESSVSTLFSGLHRSRENTRLLAHFIKLLPHNFGLLPKRLPLPMHNMALPSHLVSLPPHFARLTTVNQQSKEHHNGLQDADPSKNPCKYFYPPLYMYVLSLAGCIGLACIGGYIAGGSSRSRRGRRLVRTGWFIGLAGAFGISCTLSTFIFGNPVWFWTFGWLRGKGHSDDCSGDYQGISVTRKYLTPSNYRITVIDMANVLPRDKQIAVIGALAEGSSIRSIERITGVHRDTIMRLGVKVGKGCEMLLDSKMQDLGCRYLQFDEVWGFIGKKERHLSVDDDPEMGDVWTYCAIDSETKLVPAFKVGKRTLATTTEFVQDVASRMRNRVQISTDALRGYVEAVEESFGADVDYGQIVKVYVHDPEQHPERKYSAPSFASAYRKAVAGDPNMELVSTSHIERLNATTRLHVKRLSRLTLAFSKKLENFKAAVALNFAYYNFVRRHNTLRCTPAMAAGIERDFWSIGDLLEATS
jgi:IS1 family transposase